MSRLQKMRNPDVHDAFVCFIGPRSFTNMCTQKSSQHNTWDSPKQKRFGNSSGASMIIETETKYVNNHGTNKRQIEAQHNTSAVTAAPALCGKFDTPSAQSVSDPPSHVPVLFILDEFISPIPEITSLGKLPAASLPRIIELQQTEQ